MATYRIHRLRTHLRPAFRQAPHVSGKAQVKPRDYSPGDTVQAPSPYAAYFALRGTEAPLEPGDLLESETGELRIFKFIGFEEAQWPEPSAETAESPAAIQ